MASTPVRKQPSEDSKRAVPLTNGAQKLTEELSEEDQKLKDDLEMLVERVVEDDESLHAGALAELRAAIAGATSSMTAVPKPIKLLRDQFDLLVSVYDRWPDSDNRRALADILSVVGMTVTAPNKMPNTLRYRLLSGDSPEELVFWGHEYVRHLALEIGEEYHLHAETEAELISVAHEVPEIKSSERVSVNGADSDSKVIQIDSVSSSQKAPRRDLVPIERLVELGRKITPFFLAHNAEADAVDLLLEVDSISFITPFVDENSYARVCRYLVSCAPLFSSSDSIVCLQTAYEIYLNHKQLPPALVIALRLDSVDLAHRVFASTDDLALKKQLAFIVARQRMYINVEDHEVEEVITNIKQSDYYHYLAKELNLVDPRSPHDIYKSHLDASLLPSSSMEPSKQNLATAFVNAFVNAGYGSDKLLLNDQPDEKSWIYKTSNTGLQATAASIGVLHMWDFTNGLDFLDKYMYSANEQIQAGSLLGVGIVNAGVHDESDPAIALLGDYVDNNSVDLKTAAVMGLGLAYAGTARMDMFNLLAPLVSDHQVSMEVSALAALSLGLIFVGTADGEVSTLVMQAFLERDSGSLNDSHTQFMALSLGLLFIGRSEDTEELVETIRAIDHPMASIVETIVLVCSRCGSGDVLLIQKLLTDCATRAYEGESDLESDADDSDVELAADSENTVLNSTSSNHSGDPNDVSSAVTNESLDEQNAGHASGGAESSSNADSSLSQADAEELETKVESDEEKAQRREERLSSMRTKSYCVLGIAMVAMGEEIGQNMALRHFDHLMHYGDSHIRRVVPLAMGLLCASDPQIKVYDTLSRWSHDVDLEVAINAVFAMGLVGAGTNNARLAQLLRQLSGYYSRDPDALFAVRIAQGLIHLGKGMLTINPLNMERQILSPVALGGLLVTAFSLISPRAHILANEPRMLYYLTLAIQPRMLITVDENLEPIKVNVRVGQAVDVVGQAGKPKTITGWVTHTTPVLLAVGERAELEDEEYIPLSSFLEGIVILRKNPDYSAGDE